MRKDGRTCTTCDTFKEWSDFYPLKRGKNGRQSRCRTCSIKATTQWRQSNPEQVREYDRRWRRENRTKRLESERRLIQNRNEHPENYAKTWRQKNPEKAKELSRIHSWKSANINITYDEYLHLKKIQDNKCAICNSLPSTKELAVDHNHTTGSIRGLLCDRCNKCLGLFKDDSNLLHNAFSYLEKHDME